MGTLPLKSRDSIEIRELVITASVRNQPQTGQSDKSTPEQSDNFKKDVLAESLEKILTIIQNKNER
ncbi:MAG: hypothetical protein IH598_08865 [Bacteroidales bacterium]|nr:hypothetical protein [Bacteroidales bacterium]